MFQELTGQVLFATIVASLVVAFVIYSLYKYMAWYRTRKTIIPQYEPYYGVKALYAGYLINKKLDPHDITAGILSLAQEGFIKIRKTETKGLFSVTQDDYEITLIRNISELHDPCESKIATLLFHGVAPIGTKKTLGELQHIYINQKENRSFYLDLEWRIKRQLIHQGFLFGFDFSSPLLKYALITFCILVSLFVLFPSMNLFLILFIFVFSLFQILLVLVAGRKTKKGYEAYDHLLGFRNFLQTTEQDRYTFHNAPQLQIKEYMQYLPYAIAFGLEKQWAKVFEGVTDLNPVWQEEGLLTLGSVTYTQSFKGFTESLTGKSSR